MEPTPLASRAWSHRVHRLGFTGALLLMIPGLALAQAIPGGTLDPNTIPKYVTPLVIPPVMDDAGAADDYDIAVRQFQQQILPGGHWNALAPKCAASPGLCDLPATTVWSYGPAGDPEPDSSGIPGGASGLAPAPNSQFNYPAYTVEATKDETTTVDWINNLVRDPWSCDWTNPRGKACRYIPHLLTIDRSLHWANPEQLPCSEPGKTIDCRPDPDVNGGKLQNPYKGPVPLITHVHGAHVQPESDGYPEAWYLPTASDIPSGYATTGTLVNQFGPGRQTNRLPGVARFTYTNDQPSTTLWYHDHTLGMTRNNVYAGPAGFWLIRESGGGETGLAGGTLPGPAPVAGEDLAETNITGRGKYREIPIVIQDRGFNEDGSLFYPANRAFFEGLGDGQKARGNRKAGLRIPLTGEGRPTDIAPIWNPETFFNVMVVNGVSWPEHEVEPDLYRFRLLNGANSRFLNLSLVALDASGNSLGEVPFFQIGAEQSLMPNVVMVTTGFKTVLPGNGSIPPATPAVAPEEALLVGPAERADVIVDFGNLPAGTTHVRMLNTAPDAPFGGFPDLPADPGTTGQVMQFALVADTSAGESATPPQDLVLSLPDTGDPANGPAVGTRQDLALLEEESKLVCATMRPNGSIVWDNKGTPDPATGTCVDRRGRLRNSVPFGPSAAVIGTNGSGGGNVELWADPITERPALNATETWEMWNWSADAHPMHLHLVKFKVVDREPFDTATGALLGARPAEATEIGWKDTVIAYPGEVTRVNATFDMAGLYVWHCHIVEHEDNEMMRPFCVDDGPGCDVVP